MDSISTVWVICFLAFARNYIDGLTLVVKKDPKSPFCAIVQCSAEFPQTGSDVFTITSLSISELTFSNRSLPLASVSTFNSELIVDQLKSEVINASGGASRYDANLTIGLLDTVDCISSSFLCELDLINVTGQSETLRQVVQSDQGDDVSNLMGVLSSLVTLYQTQSTETNTRLTNLEEDINQLTRLSLLVQSKLDAVLTALNQLNETKVVNQHRIQCYRGMPHNQTRQKVQLWGQTEALCDTHTDGGGWVVLQRRTTGDVDFYRDWESYKNGFGTPETDYWIGNDVIHNLTSQGFTELRIDLSINGTSHFVHYSFFQVADEGQNYKLNVSNFSGTVSDLLHFHQDMGFSTFDRDNDGSSDNCALDSRGGWWYNKCYSSNLNGLWGVHHESGLAIVYVNYVYPEFSEMKVRRVE